MKLKLSFLTLVMSFLAFAQSAPAYYNGIDFTKRGNQLKMQLATLISKQTHTTTYSELLTQYQYSDADPQNKSNILLIYGYSNINGDKTQRSRAYNTNNFNREHVFPKSLGSPNLGTSGPGADLHHVRPSDNSFNSDRGNLPFADGKGNAGKTNGGWYPGDEWKGDVARIILYMYLRYGNQTNPDAVGLGPNTYAADVPDIFIKWNIEDPVSDFERQRQEVAYNFQGNRNPFIDNPYLATAIWGGPDAVNTWPTTFQTAPATPDTEAPTAATNLAAKNPTANSIDLSWTPANDNIGVMSYDLYVNGVLKTTINGSLTSTTVTGLAANTSYNFYIIAKDAAGNVSPASNTVTASTNNVVVTPPSNSACITDDFETIPANSSSYSNRTWTKNGITWNATLARTDETINNRAITINTSGKLTSSTYAKGIGSITITTQLKYTGTAGNLDVLVNGKKVGTIPYSDEIETTTISDINVEGDVTVSIENNSSVSKTRVAIDDLSWSCYPDPNNVSTNETSANKTFKIYPNPVTNQELNIIGLENTDNSAAQIYSISGQLVQTVKDVKNNSKISLKQLPKGLYLLKIGTQTAKFIIK